MFHILSGFLSFQRTIPLFSENLTFLVGWSNFQTIFRISEQEKYLIDVGNEIECFTQKTLNFLIPLLSWDDFFPWKLILCFLLKLLFP